MSSGRKKLSHRQVANLLQRHSAVTIKPMVLRRDFAGSICKLPWRIRKYGGKSLAV
jgi:hypothetical protein